MMGNFNKESVRPNDLDVVNVASQSEFRYVPYPHELKNK